MDEIDDIINNSNEIIKKSEKKNTYLAIIKLLIFFGLLYSIYISFSNSNLTKILILFALILIFVSLYFFSSKINDIITLNKNILHICDEILTEKSENNNLSNSFFNTHHPYILDLDIFGKNSLFEKINKTQTFFGLNKIIFFLSNPLQKLEEIIYRQESIKELSKKVNWAILFLATTRSIGMNTKNKKFVFDNDAFNKLDDKIFKLCLFLIPLINVFLLSIFLISRFSILSIAFLLLTILIAYVINKIYGNYVNQICNSIELKSNDLKKFVSAFDLIENEIFDSKENILIKNQLFKNDNKASTFVRKLSYLIGQYENRNAFLIGGILNIFFLWNLQFAFKIGKLINESKNDISKWFDTVGEFEALVSLGLFTYKNKEFTFPTISKNESIKTINLSHPLLTKENRIGNDFSISSENDIAIITGANMTGKSTFLRTIGVNMVLAMNGCPVCAESFSFKPVSIFTSMRTNDSLSDGSSYFNAEIKRLKILIEKLENNEPQFIILDEILKGTNSEDKLKGSKLFLEKIIKMDTKTTCIIATHDLDLTKMEDEFPKNIKNYCFELHNIKGNLEPDYKLSEGVTKNMNAIRLMKEYKIID